MTVSSHSSSAHPHRIFLPRLRKVKWSSSRRERQVSDLGFGTGDSAVGLLVKEAAIALFPLKAQYRGTEGRGRSPVHQAEHWHLKERGRAELQALSGQPISNSSALLPLGFGDTYQHGRSLCGDVETSPPPRPDHGPVHHPWAQVLHPRGNRYRKQTQGRRHI